MTTINVTPQLSLDANGNLVLGGTPTGAATTDKLQVNGHALINGMRFEDASGGGGQITETASGSHLTFKAGDGAAGAGGGDLLFKGGTGSAPTGAGGRILFMPGSGLVAPGGVQFFGTYSVNINPWTGAFDFVSSSSGVGGKLSILNLKFGTYTGSADAVSNGFITIEDAAGNTRKLMTRA